MKTKRLLTMMAACAAFAIGASATFAQQASLTLRGCDTALCNHNDTAWTLEKSGTYTETTDTGVGTVTWTVTATRGATSDNTIEVNGVITIENTGSAPATIGNIVVNLQKRATPPGGQPTWVSAAADMADGTVGNTATKANIAAAASAEDPAANLAVGAHNYTTPGGGLGVFIKTAGSDTVEFTDVSDNTAFSLVPEKVIPPGGTVTLKYTATFNNSVIGLANGAQVRSEAIVSFGNAGGRGDSGASSPNIDINGSGVIDADEAHVRSVPCRVSKDLPPLQRCNDTVTLTDTDPDSLSTSGTASWLDFVTDIGAGTGIEVISATTTRSVSVSVAGGVDGGEVCNTAYLTGESSSIAAGIFTFPCCTGVALNKLSCVTVPPQGTPPPPPNNPEGCTYTQGGWGNKAAGNNVGALLANNFDGVYGVGGQVVIGGTKTITFKTKTTWVYNNTAQNLNQVPTDAANIRNAQHYSNQNTSPSGALNVVQKANGKYDYDLVVVAVTGYYLYDLGTEQTAVQAITAFLPQGGTPGTLDNTLENPTSSSAHVFAGQVLALKLNVDFGVAGVINPVGGNTICHTGTAADGQTIAQVLAAANVALGGGALPYGMTDISQLNDLVDNINRGYDGCVVNDWAKGYTCPAAP